MSRFYPTTTCNSVTQITRPMLERLGVKALILDVDNTLTTHNNPLPQGEILEWLQNMHAQNISMVLVSNNRSRRVSAFAKKLGLDYTANAMKPLTHGFRKTAGKLGLAPQEIAVIGDQIFTDVWGGNRFGAVTILTRPISLEGGAFFRLKRQVELRILRKYRQERGR